MRAIIGTKPDSSNELENKTIIEAEDNAIFNIEQALTPEIEKAESAEEVVMENFFGTTLTDYDDFDERCWNKGDGYKIPGYPSMEHNLEGVESGMYLFAGESNSGYCSLS